MIRSKATYNSISLLATLKLFLAFSFLLCVFAKPTLDIILVISDYTYELSENLTDKNQYEKEENKTDSEIEKIITNLPVLSSSIQVSQNNYFQIQKNKPSYKLDIHLPPPKFQILQTRYSFL